MPAELTGLRAGTGVRRSLGRFEVTCLGINAIIGAGIFALPDDLFREAGGASPLLFVVCALGLLPIAWCYARASGETERTGGPYIYVSRAFGSMPGFIVGWMCFVNSIFSFAAVARIAAAYLIPLVPGLHTSGSTLRTLGVVVVAAFCGMNALGAKPGARIAAAFTLGKILALLILVVAAVPAVVPSRWWVPPPHGASGIGLGIFIALFAVQGFEVTPVPAGETKNAGRVMPFAILASLIGASLLYVLVQAMVVGVHPGLAQPSDTPLADAARSISPRLGLLIGWGGVISTMGFVAGNAFGTPRYAYAMAEDGYLPRALAYVDAKRGAPLGAILATGICAAVLTATFSERALVGISNLAVAVQYLGTCLAVAWAGRRTKARRSLTMIVAGLGAAVSVWIMCQGDAVERMTAVAAIAVGIGVGLLSRRTTRADAAT